MNEEDRVIEGLERARDNYRRANEYGHVTVECVVHDELTLNDKEASLRIAKDFLVQKVSREIVEKFAFDIHQIEIGSRIAGKTRYTLDLYIHTVSEMKKVTTMLELWSKIVKNLHERYKDMIK